MLSSSAWVSLTLGRLVHSWLLDKKSNMKPGTSFDQLMTSAWRLPLKPINFWILGHRPISIQPLYLSWSQASGSCLETNVRILKPGWTTYVCSYIPVKATGCPAPSFHFLAFLKSWTTLHFLINTSLGWATLWFLVLHRSASFSFIRYSWKSSAKGFNVLTLPALFFWRTLQSSIGSGITFLSFAIFCWFNPNNPLKAPAEDDKH